MKRLIALLLALTVSAPSFAAEAFRTGRLQRVTVGATRIWNCEYNYLGQTFWQTFTTFCPFSIEVE